MRVLRFGHPLPRTVLNSARNQWFPSVCRHGSGSFKRSRKDSTNVRYASGTSDQVLFSTMRGSGWPNHNTALMELSLGHPLPRMVLNILVTCSELPSACRCPHPETEIRRAVFARFPYAIVYGVENDPVIVIAVAHAHREPRYWWIGHHVSKP